MKILFLPIDVNVSDLKFDQVDLPRFDSYSQLFWNTGFIGDDAIKKNNLNVILDQLPFVKITALLYKIQLREVHPHIDVYPHMRFQDGEVEHIKTNEPVGYRLVIKGKSDSLLVNDSVDWDCTKVPHTPRNGGNWIRTQLPSVPGCYLINSTETVHSVLDEVGRTTIYIRGFIDPERHQELIRRSYEKYRDWAVIAR